MKSPNKQYVRLMAERYGLRVERNRKQCAMTIWSNDGIIIFSGFDRQVPEKAWENLWISARHAVERHTGVLLYDVWNDMYVAQQIRKGKAL